MDKLMILGAGGHGRVAAQTAYECGYAAAEFLDDGHCGDSIVGKCGDYPRFLLENLPFFVALGNNDLRKQWLLRLEAEGADLPALIHPRSYVCPGALIGPGAIVEAGALVNAGAVVGKGAIIGLGAIVDHDAVIGPFCHINSGSVVQAGCAVPELTRLDSGECFTKNGIKRPLL